MARPRSKTEVFTVGNIDEAIANFERASARREANAGSKVKLLSAERDLLQEAELSRELLVKAMSGDKHFLAEVFGGDCERFYRYREVLDDTVFTDGNKDDARWKGLREAIETIEEILKDQGAWNPRKNGPPEEIEYKRVPKFFTPGVVVSHVPEVTGDCPLTSLKWSVEPALPGLLELNPQTGELKGQAQVGCVAPMATYVITAQNGQGLAKFELSFGCSAPPPEEVAYNLTRVIVGQPISWQPNVEGGAPEVWSISPELPNGLTLDPGNGTISGSTAIRQDATKYVIKASNAAGEVEAVIEFQIVGVKPKHVLYPCLQTSPFLEVGASIYLMPEVTMACPAEDGDGETIVKVQMEEDGSKWNRNFDTSGVYAGGSADKWKRGNSKAWEDLVAKGLVPQFVFSIQPDLPPGLHLVPSTGVISGKLTEKMPKTVYHLAVNNAEGEAHCDLCIAAVVKPPSGLQYPTMPGFLAAGSAVSFAPEVVGLVTKWEISPDLPNGLVFDVDLGTISGVPSKPSGIIRYEVTATNEGGSDTFDMTITVTRAPPTDLTYGVPVLDYPVCRYMELLPAIEGQVEEWKVEPALPTGVKLDTATGKISGTPTEVTPFTTYRVTASGESGSISKDVAFEIKVMPPGHIVYSGIDDSYEVGEAVSLEPTVEGGADAWAVEPALPDGMVLDTATGKITGAPAKTVQEEHYSVTASNEAGGTSVVITFSVGVSKPHGLAYHTMVSECVVGHPVAWEPTTVKGGQGATFAVSPALPPGLKLDPQTGMVSGTPTETCPQKDYKVTATNSLGSCERILTFSVSEPQQEGDDAVEVDQAFAAECEDVRDPTQMPPEPDRKKRLGDWMVWMVHRAYLNDPTLEKFDFTRLPMPLPVEPRVAPKLAKAMGRNTTITSLLLADSNLKAPTGVGLAQSMRKNCTLKVLNIESNSLDADALIQLAAAFKESPDNEVDTLRIAYQRGCGSSFGRTVEQALAEMLKENTKITKLGCSFEDANWKNTSDRALLRNADAARRRKKGGQQVAQAIQKKLMQVTLGKPPDRAAWEVFDDQDANMSLCRDFVAAKKVLPSSQHLQAHAKTKDQKLAFAQVGPLLKAFHAKLFEAAISTEITCKDDKKGSTKGTLAKCEEKNNRWTLEVCDAGGKKYEFVAEKQPVLELTAEFATWLTPAA